MWWRMGRDFNNDDMFCPLFASIPLNLGKKDEWDLHTNGGGGEKFLSRGRGGFLRTARDNQFLLFQNFCPIFDESPDYVKQGLSI